MNGAAPKLYLLATHEKTLQVTFGLFKKMAFDTASRVIVSAHTHQTGELTHAETCRSVSLSVH